MDNVEKWKDIPHYEGLYQVSNLGRIWSIRKQRVIKPFMKNSGYYSICLTDSNGKHKEERVHRLVALAFIPNPNKYPVINHKNEIKTDNRVENLEWCTPQYNTLYSSYKWSGTNNAMANPIVRAKQKKACQHAHDFESYKVLDTQTGIIYKSIREAEKQTGVSRYLVKHTDRFKVASEKGGSCSYEN